jgi:hypothetical protein
MAALFGGFVGTTGSSDFSEPFIVGLGLMAFPTRPGVPPRQAVRKPPGSRTERFRTCTGSATAQDCIDPRDIGSAHVAFRFG